MKNHALASFIAIGTWFFILFGFISLVANGNIPYLGIRYSIWAGIFGGILGGLAYLFVSKTKKLSLLIPSIALLGLSWVIAFPTPSWKNSISWNWPIPGLLCILLVVLVGNLKKNLQ